jgi:pimeloyl-ACP methyl ester carboxylesterase
VPTLVMVGGEDSPFYRPSKALVDGIPDARLCVVPQAMHCPEEEEPEAFNEMLL